MRQEWDYPPPRSTYIEASQQPLSWRHKKVKAAVNIYFSSIILVLKVMASVVLLALLYFCFVFARTVISL